MAEVKALACELPARLGLPLSRFSREEIRRHVLSLGLVAEISGMTIWRWLREDAIRPWSRRSWVFPRDPQFGEKAGVVLDNGTIHRGERARRRLQERWPNLIPVYLPVHASWLKQIEIYFSVLQRKALTPDDFDSRDALEARILGFQQHYQQVATPFEWKFTRQDLAALLKRCSEEGETVQAAA